jgi:hypothetical protein
LLPQAMRAFSDLLLGRLGQLHLLLWKHGPNLGGPGGAWRRGRAGQPSAATLARRVKLRPCARVPARPPPGSRCPSGLPHPAKVTGTTPARSREPETRWRDEPVRAVLPHEALGLTRSFGSEPTRWNQPSSEFFRRTIRLLAVEDASVHVEGLAGHERGII